MNTFGGSAHGPESEHRSTIYQRLQPVIGEEKTEPLLSHFPARDLDEPATKEFLRAEMADLVQTAPSSV